MGVGLDRNLANCQQFYRCYQGEFSAGLGRSRAWKRVEGRLSDFGKATRLSVVRRIGERHAVGQAARGG